MNEQYNFFQQLGVKHPIIQGGMAWVSNQKLVTAVCKEGAIGILTSVIDNLDLLRDEIRELKKKNFAFGVNIMMKGTHIKEIAELLAEEKVPLITVGGGNPIDYVERWHKAGCVVVPVVGSVNYAIMMERAGADAIIAEGMESGGHVGRITTLSLVPQVLSAVDIPVIAAGGIFDKQTRLAMEALGAIGVQIGTRLIAAKESEVHENYKKKLIQANDTDTVLLDQGSNLYIRALKSTFTREYLKLLMKRNNMTDQEKQSEVRGRFKLAVQQGDEELGCFLAGQVAGRIKDIQTVQEIIKELI